VQRELTRIPWVPSNGTDGMILMARHCDKCEQDRGESCRIIARSLCGEQPPEWTAEDCTGKGFACSAFQPRRPLVTNNPGTR
jgi:hypothetical protein